MPSAAPPRSYKMTRRAEAMAQTRKKILDAARELFLREDFQSVSLDSVAKAAGVGRTTVFEQFESRTGLLRALEAEVSARAGVEALLPQLLQEDVLQAMRAAFVVGAEVWGREREMFRKLFSAGRLDSELGQVMTEKDATRHQLVKHLVKGLERGGHLRPGVSPRTARDVLALLTTFESFDTLLAQTGSVKKVAQTQLEMMSAYVARLLPEKP